MVSFPVLSEAVVRILHEVVQREEAQVPFPFVYFILIDFFLHGEKELKEYQGGIIYIEKER